MKGFEFDLTFTFQFYYGSINSINIFCDEDSLINFNSTMVQLIGMILLVILDLLIYFNSTMVQLIAVIKLRQKYL